MKNYLLHTLWLTLSVLLILLLMNHLPVVKVFGHELRPVDILGDVRPGTPEDDPEDTLSIPVPVIVKPAFVDTCRTGLTCIEDYSDSTLRGMTHFYRMLDKLNTLDRPVRIGVFGDSFIEADIFTADLREKLQNKYGGCGVGYVDITSATYGFRPTVRHSFKGWETHLQTDSIGFNSKRQGLSGSYFIPTKGAYVELRGQTKYASRLDTCEQASIYFYAQAPVDMAVRINKDAAQQKTVQGGSDLKCITVDGRIGSVRWTVNQADSALFFGVAMDGKSGISVDNLSLRGSTGMTLGSIPAKTLKDFNKKRTYDLIILQYGLNVATQRGRDYAYYQKGMIRTVNYLKDCFPDASILLVGVGDRDYKTSTGDIQTMPGVKNLIPYQQAIASETSIAFWNLFEAMGGDGSMANLVKAKPAQANLDYTHINFRGGEVLSGLLYETLVYGKERFDRRMKYEAE